MAKKNLLVSGIAGFEATAKNIQILESNLNVLLKNTLFKCIEGYHQANLIEGELVTSKEVRHCLYFDEEHEINEIEMQKVAHWFNCKLAYEKSLKQKKVQDILFKLTQEEREIIEKYYAKKAICFD